MADFSCTTDTSPGMAIVHAAGDIDLATADQLWEALLAHLIPGTRVVLDCTGITFCDSTGLRTLIRAHHHAAATGADFALCAIDGPVGELIKLAGTTGLIPVADPTVTDPQD